MNDWGTPNWRIPAAYGNVKGWNFNRWRWEFYRRREDLREYFEARAEETYQEFQQYAGMPGFPVAHLRPDEPGFCAMVDVEARKRFGYSGIPNPRIGAQPEDLLLLWETDGTISSRKGDRTGRNGWRGTFGELLSLYEIVLTEEQASLLKEWMKFFPIELQRNEVAVTFDVNRPLEPQLATARSMLKRLYESRDKPRQRRRHPSKWLGYLRALDARESGATWLEIANVFYVQGLLDRCKDPSGGYCAPPPQAARDVWQAANALRFNF